MKTDRALAELEADEGTIWLLDEAGDHLIPMFNNGPSASNLIGCFQQALDKGIISMVLATQSAMIEREIYKNPQHDGSLDQQLGLVTVHMMAAPLYFADESRGVISAVRLRSPDADETADPSPFDDHDLASFKQLTHDIGRHLDKCLITLSQESPES